MNGSCQIWEKGKRVSMVNIQGSIEEDENVPKMSRMTVQQCEGTERLLNCTTKSG